MIFSSAKSITIPEGNVTKIAVGNTILWEKITAPTYTDLVPTAKYTDGSILDGVGYRRKITWNGNNLNAVNNAFTAIGLIAFGNGTVQHDIYVYGLDFSGSGSNRYYVYGASYNMLDGVISNLKDGYTSTGILLSVTKLGDHYYKFRSKAYSTSVKYFTISGVTVDGMIPVVTLDEPIM